MPAKADTQLTVMCFSQNSHQHVLLLMHALLHCLACSFTAGYDKMYPGQKVANAVMFVSDDDEATSKNVVFIVRSVHTPLPVAKIC